MKKTIAVFTVIACILAAGLLFPPVTYAPVADPKPLPPKETAISLDISCVGDIMVHSTQYKAQYDPATDSYDFDDNFQYVKPYIEKADLALCNLETVFAGGRLSGYPAFNAPDSLAGTLSDTGFDVAMLANNHALDQGTKGLVRTIDIAEAEGLQVSGAHKEGGKGYTLFTTQKISIGIISYTYETPEINGRRSLNGNVMSDTALSMLNTFSYSDMDRDLSRIESDINQAKEAGAEIIICYFHWGEEYQREPNNWQISMAKKVADMGADMIFASHPHVLQPAEKLVNADTGKETAVFYSMGNFISNQRTETLDNRYTEQGVIAQVSLDIMKSTGKISNVKMKALPVWLDRFKSGGKTRYAIIPLDGEFKDNPVLAESGHLRRAEQALMDCINLFGEEYISPENPA